MFPVWLPWVSLLTIPAAFTAAWLVSRAACWLLFRRVLLHPNTHWTERARLAWPARQRGAFLSLGVPLLLGATLSHAGGGLSMLPSVPLGVLTGLAAIGGFMLGSLAVARRLRPKPLSARRYFQSILSIWLLRGPLFVGTAVFAAIMPDSFGWRTAALLVAGTALVYALAFGGNLLLGRFLGLVHPAGDRVQGIVAAISSEAGVPPPGAFEMRCLAPLAFAFPVRRQLVFADSVLSLLDDAELEAVASHEVAHLTEGRKVTLQRASGLLLLTLLMAARPLSCLDGRSLFFAVLLSLLLLVGLGAFSRRTWRRMETRADTLAAARDAAPGTYARALEKVHEAGLIPAVLRRGATHPDLWDRMLSSGLAPSWKRPEPPPLGHVWAMALLLVSVFAACGLIWDRALGLLARTSPLSAVAVTGGAPWTLDRLAFQRYGEKRYREAAELYRAAFRSDGIAGHLANAALAELQGGHCADARRTSREADAALPKGVGRRWDVDVVARAARAAALCGDSHAAGEDEGLAGIEHRGGLNRVK